MGVLSASQSPQHVRFLGLQSTDNGMMSNSSVEVCKCGRNPQIKIFGSDKNPEFIYAMCENSRCQYFKWLRPITVEDQEDEATAADGLELEEESENDEMLERVEHLEEEINNLKSNMSHVKAELSGFKPQLSELKRKTGRFKASMDAMEGALVASVICLLCLIFFLLVRDNSRSCGVQDHGGEVASIATVGPELEGKGENEEMLERVEHLEKEIDDLKSNVSNVKAEISGFEPELSALKMKHETRGFKVDMGWLELLCWTIAIVLCFVVLLVGLPAYIHLKVEMGSLELVGWIIAVCLCSLALEFGLQLYIHARACW